MDNPTKLTLLPYGPPPSTPESQEKCRELLIYCDADTGRFHDRSWKNPARFSLPPGVKSREYDPLERFLEHALRLVVLKDPNLSAIVALTHTCPLNRVVIQARQRIVAALPSLAKALWVIYVDFQLDPNFEESARKLGNFDPPDLDLKQVPYWKDRTFNQSYLVLTPFTKDGAYIRLRARMLAARTVAALDREASSTTLRAVKDRNSRP